VNDKVNDRVNGAGLRPKDNAAKAEGRETGKAGVVRRAGAKVAAATGANAVTTGGAAIAAASKGRRKSTSRN
jgi:hypothetical protein